MPDDNYSVRGPHITPTEISRLRELRELLQITLFTGNNSNPLINQHGPRVSMSVTIITLYYAHNRKQHHI